MDIMDITVWALQNRFDIVTGILTFSAFVLMYWINVLDKHVDELQTECKRLRARLNSESLSNSIRIRKSYTKKPFESASLSLDEIDIS